MAYFLKKIKQKNGKTFLEIVDSVYVKRSRSSTHKVFKSLGYLEDLEKIYKDPIAHFKKEAADLELLRKSQKASTPIPEHSSNKNLGSFVFKRLLNKLGLSNIFIPFPEVYGVDYPIYDIFEFLTLCRIIYPASRLDSYTNHLHSFFTDYSFSKSQMYQALSLIGQNDSRILEYLNICINKHYKRNLDHVYFDCTNYYFEIDASSYDEYRTPGPSKENHQGAIISMGLLLDADAIPLYYKLFPGNQSEKPVFNDVIDSMKKSCDVRGKTIRVADKGLNCTENIIKAHISGDGYVYSKAIRSNDDRTMILQLDGYEETKDENGNVVFKSKSWVDTYEYSFEGRTYQLKEKRIVIWSRKYAEKARYEREKAMAKVDMSSSTSTIKKTLASKAVDTLYDVICDDNGCILKSDDISLVINESKLSQKEELDGYYMIITSETNLSWKEILDTYRKLWEIEASFRLTKTQFQARPIYASTIESIRGHFATCYMALTLTRLLQKKELDDAFNAESIIKFARGLNAFPIGDEKYSLFGYSPLVPALEQKYKIHFNSQVLSLAEIKKLTSF